MGRPGRAPARAHGARTPRRSTDLRRRGLVYRCRCSRREIADSGVRGIDGIVYPGTCREAAVPPGRSAAATRVHRPGRHRRIRRPRAGPGRAAPRGRDRRLRGPPPRRALRLPARGRRRRRRTRRDRRRPRRRPPRFHPAADRAAAAPWLPHALVPARADRDRRGRTEALQADPGRGGARCAAARARRRVALSRPVAARGPGNGRRILAHGSCRVESRADSRRSRCFRRRPRSGRASLPAYN